MLISYKWLKDYIDAALPPEKLAELFTLSGLSVASVRKHGDDQVIEIEVTSNRPDWLSYTGVARELAAITKSSIKALPARKACMAQPAVSAPTVAVKVAEPALCSRYTAIAIKNVKVGPSPSWLKEKIESMGLRSVNNIVDITNFCLFETGEPMHAFDLDKLMGGEITVRLAAKGEKITGIDGQEKMLDDTMLVIADKERAVAVAGVMGGANTEVTGSTTNILLEAAAFDPISVRRTARKLATATESSYRFERKVDVDNIVPSRERAVELILQLAGGEAGAPVDIGAKPEAKRKASLRFDKMRRSLDLNISDEEGIRILASLGLKLLSNENGVAEFEVPRLRQDLDSEMDLVEEVARIYGYDKIPVAVPAMVEQPIRWPREDIIENRARSVLVGMGLCEILTYSLLSRKLAGFEGVEGDNIVEVVNPLSSEQEMMRPGLLAGLLNVMMRNINRKSKDLRLFELGSVYAKTGPDSFSEKASLSIGISGQISSGAFGATRACDFFNLKGIIEVIFRELGIKDIHFKESQDKRFSPACRAAIEIAGAGVGLAGELSAGLLANFDIKEKVYAAFIDFDSLYKYANLEKHFTELPRYPSVSRDISLLAGKEVSNGDIMSAIKKEAGAILKDVQLIDRYIGKQIPEGKASLTYRLEYQDPQKTLEDKDVNSVHSKIVAMLETRLGAKQR